MACNYLYIDDNSEENARGIITGLQSEGLTIDFENPKGNWENERERIFSAKFKSYNGLILDLNLEEIPNKSQATSRYKGSTLAQEIRNLSKAGTTKEIPIILLSATINLDRYFDKTNEDLFDLIISREKLGHFFISTREKLISLANGYDLITKCKNYDDLQELFKHDLRDEDIRFVDEIQTVLMAYPAHTISNFVIKHILTKTGILIPENILATRLGINIDQSRDWGKVIEQLTPHIYKGVFFEGWKRWWMNGVEHWWRSELKIENSLRATKANIKVEFLKEKLGLSELVAIQKVEKAKSETFWTNCVGSGISIDTTDGLLIAGQDNNFPWQDKRYISYEEALKPKSKDLWKKLSPSEDYKLDVLKKKYPNERPAQ